MSDGIEAFILSLLQDSEGVELRRNELAQYFGCAPSQINYVLTTRFSVEHGYLVQSKRGGGGYIFVQRIPPTQQSLQDCVVQQIGQTIPLNKARALIQNLQRNQAVTDREGGMLRAAVANLPIVAGEMQDYARAHILKAMLLSLLGGACRENKAQKQSEGENGKQDDTDK